MTADNKRYDGTATAILDNSKDQLSGLATGDSVSFTASATATFSDPGVGNGKTVTASGFTLSGPDAADYALIQPTAAANIMYTATAVASAGIDINALTVPFVCNVGNGADHTASGACTTHIATHAVPLHIFYNIPTNLMLIHEEPMTSGDYSDLR
jgi:hypothetical protein